MDQPEMATTQEMRAILHRISKVLDVWEIEADDPATATETLWSIAIADCLAEIRDAINNTTATTG